jgi:hypothetical protein
LQKSVASWGASRISHIKNYLSNPSGDYVRRLIGEISGWRKRLSKKMNSPRNFSFATARKGRENGRYHRRRRNKRLTWLLAKKVTSSSATTSAQAVVTLSKKNPCKDRTSCQCAALRKKRTVAENRNYN